MKIVQLVLIVIIFVLFAKLVSPFTLPVLDNFEREVLGENWTQVEGGNITVENGKLKTSGQDTWGYYNRVKVNLTSFDIIWRNFSYGCDQDCSGPQQNANAGVGIANQTLFSNGWALWNEENLGTLSIFNKSGSVLAIFPRMNTSHNYDIRMKYELGTLFVKFWNSSESEPGNWNYSGVQSTWSEDTFIWAAQGPQGVAIHTFTEQIELDN